ncbi:hypothetical protein C8R46DRAFT_73635 [Mycena filopes]|nr:hypothetical protein C8R46DRAFT_73635 [Mycena filopes]
MAKESSLPPSLRAHLYDRPQEPQGLSPTTSSPGAQDEVDLPSPTFAPPRQPAFPLPPIVPSTLPPAFPDARRQYSAYEPGAHDPARRHSPTRLSPLGGSSSIPHGPARRYRSPVGSDPLHPATVRQQPPAGYPGSVSLPALSQITAPPSHWREGEAGPSSLVHSSHTYGALRRQSPNYPPPQGIYRRATEPGGYPSESAHLQPGFHGSYERLREQPEGYPSRPTPGHQYSESSSSRLSLPPLYGRAGEQVDLPPLYSALQSQSSLSSDFTRVDDGPRGVKRHFPEDFEDERRAFQNMPRKILVACDFCRGKLCF